MVQMVKNRLQYRRPGIPRSGRSPGEGHGNPLHLSGKIPRTEELAGLQSMGSHRVGLD